jgi:multidrug resistance efflux pump
VEIRPERHADISVDAFRGEVFSGHVDGIQRASGARFSLPPKTPAATT